MSTSDVPKQQVSGTPASSIRHPRHLPTPIVTQHSKMAMQSGPDQDTARHSSQVSLPPLRQVVDDNERAGNKAAPEKRDVLRPGSTVTRDVWRAVPISPKGAFDANEVMRKAMETMNEQIRANGYDPNNLPNRNQATDTTANGNNQVGAGTTLHPGNSIKQADPSSGQGGEDNDEDSEPNPYQERADEIGLSHRIPGVGHLGDLLTPPGWKAGDEPISISRARLLQKQAYQMAREKLDASIAEFKDLKGAAFQEASDLRNEQWQNLNDLNKLICEERVKIWADYQERKKGGGQERPEDLPLRYPSRASWHPPARVFSGPAAYYHQSSRPAPPALTLTRPSTDFDGPEPSPKLISPSNLDPSLVPSTVHTVIEDFTREKQHLSKLAHDNEIRLKQCLSRYGPYLYPDHQLNHPAVNLVQHNAHPNSQAVREVPYRRRFSAQTQQHQGGGISQQNHDSECGTVEQARGRSEYPDQRPEHWRSESSQQNSRWVYGPTAPPAQSQRGYPTPPLPGYPTQHTESYMRSGNGQADHAHRNQNQGLTANRYHYLPSRTGLGHYEEPSDLALTPVKPQHQRQDADDTEVDEAPAKTPSKKRKAPTKKPSPKKSDAPKPVSKSPPKPTKPTAAAKKQASWYASHLATANLPTSTIDPEAIQAGLAYDPKGPRGSAPPPPKKRRRGSEPVPVPAFVMPQDKIKLMFKSGMPIRYTGKGPNPYVEDGGANAKGGAKESAPIVPAMGSGEKAKPAVGSKNASLTAGEASKVVSSGYSTKSKADEEADDPTDENYDASGARGKQGGTPKRKSPRKSVLAKRTGGGRDE
ncbi:MAG: hypothetical protein Q9208_004922 [Pyrenodesmia sp. 3 TL-2023]